MSSYEYKKSRRSRTGSVNPWDDILPASVHVQTHVLWEYMDDCTYEDLFMGKVSFKDILGAAGKAPGEFVVDDPKFGESFPILYQLMSCSIDDDRKPRKTCTLTMVCEDGQVKLGVKERNHNLSLWTSSQTLGGAFAALEEALSESPVKWRKVEWKGRR